MMFVACSTLCFSTEPLEAALRQIAELEFNKIDLAHRSRAARTCGPRRSPTTPTPPCTGSATGRA